MIPVKNGCPDFSHYTHGSVTVSGGFGVNRDANFKEFDRSLAEKWSKEGIPKEYENWFNSNGIDADTILPGDIKNFREENKMVWHEHQNQKTAMLLDRSIHNARSGGVPHMGGIAEIKAKMAQKDYNIIKNQGEK